LFYVVLMRTHIRFFIFPKKRTPFPPPPPPPCVELVGRGLAFLPDIFLASLSNFCTIERNSQLSLTNGVWCLFFWHGKGAVSFLLFCLTFVFFFFFVWGVFWVFWWFLDFSRRGGWCLSCGVDPLFVLFALLFFQCGAGVIGLFWAVSRGLGLVCFCVIVFFFALPRQMRSPLS